MKKVTLNINGCLPQVHDGKDGVDGKSAYQIWLDNGNTGSEAEFLESLKGPKGADGIIGKDGATGPKGDTGAQGPMGAQGLRGEVGAKGDTGERGPQGEKGEQGLKGDKGDKGDTGPAGPQGPAGRDGEGADFCTAFDALPEVSWKKGTTIIAKQDGACVRLTSFDSIFQEIGVGITADKTNGLVSDNYKVVVTVSNTGEGKNELTNLNIVGPANTEDYEIKEVSFTKSEADEVEQVDNLTYNIRGLKKGGTVKVKYTVVPKVKGTYQFTAAVNPNSPLNKDLGNNNATIILRSDTASKAITGENCPAITLTDVDTGNVLTQVEAADNKATNPFVGTATSYIDKTQYINIFKNRTSLQGLVLEADSDLTVITNHSKFENAKGGLGTVDGRVFAAYPSSLGTNLYGNTFISPSVVHEITTQAVNVEGRRITVTADANALVLVARPRGANCYWQVYVLFANAEPVVEKINITNLVGGALTNVRVPKGMLSTSDNKANMIPDGLTSITSINGGNVEKQVVTVKKGTAATATVDFGTLTKFYSSGLVEITANSLTVSADATPSDSIRSTYLDVIIEE